MTAVIFLGGVLTPARFRFIPLLAALGSPPDAVAKELELYTHGRIPDDYSLTMEIDGLDHFATEHGYESFHLYGYSIGASIALAYVAAHGERVVSLALEEPATDFSKADRDQLAADNPENLADLPEDRRMQVFLRSLTRPGVVLTPPPAAPPSPEMAMRPAGLGALDSPVRDHQVDSARLRAFQRPVYFSYGSLSNARWESMADRAAATFADCTVERYEGLHHLHTSHQAEPQRVAGALRAVWARGERDQG